MGGSNRKRRKVFGSRKRGGVTFRSRISTIRGAAAEILSSHSKGNRSPGLPVVKSAYCLSSGDCGHTSAGLFPGETKGTPLRKESSNQEPETAPDLRSEVYFKSSRLCLSRLLNLSKGAQKVHLQVILVFPLASVAFVFIEPTQTSTPGSAVDHRASGATWGRNA